MRSFLFCILFATRTFALQDGLGRTPHMGWNSWNTFHANINETPIRDAASALVSRGLLAAGYKYLTMDAGWSARNRMVDGKKYPDPDRFPTGIMNLTSDLHALGFLVGIYSDGGLFDCNFDPGSYGYEEVDAQTFADWGIDLLKYDNCGGFHAMVETHQMRFGRMRDALKHSGRDIFYSLCQWGSQFPWFWADAVSHTYRMSGDITNLFGNEGKADCPCSGTAYCLNTGYGGCSVLTIIRKMRQISTFSKPGSFADMDMLELGNIPNETLAQDRTHFAFWAALKSPLIIGANPSALSEGQIKILTNSDLIAINQDQLGKAVVYQEVLSREGEWQVWSGPLEGEREVMLILNEGENVRKNMSVALHQVKYCRKGWDVKDVWKGNYRKVEPGEVIMLELEAFDTGVLWVSCL